jgi:hypothetical protein
VHACRQGLELDLETYRSKPMYHKEIVLLDIELGPFVVMGVPVTVGVGLTTTIG